MQTRSNLKQLLAEKKVIKAIAGIANFDKESVLSVARAAETAAVPVLDIAADPAIIAAVRPVFSGVLMASGITTASLVAAVEVGADAVELGNFDALYDQGIFVSAQDVIALSQEITQALAGRVFISITIPGHLSQETQIALAKELEAMGNVDVIQTEGATRVLSTTPQTATLSADEKASVSLSNTRALVQATRLPVMTASGFDTHNLLDAFAVGAAAVGIGSAVNQLSTEAEQAAKLTEMQALLTQKTMTLAS